MKDGNDTPEQAVALAREAVRSGLTDKTTAMRLVQEYVAAPGGPFGQLLVTRGLVDQGGLSRLQAAAAAASAANTSAPSLWLPAMQPPRPPSDPGRPPSGSGSGGGPVRPSSDPRDSQRLRKPPSEAEGKTGRWGAATAAPSPAPAPVSPERSVDAPFGLSDRTLAYDPVLKKPGDSASREFDPIVSSSGSADERLTSTASSSRDASGESVDLGLDSVAVDLTTSAEAAHQRQPAAGDVVGAYELRGVLGSGGMGVIFEARKAGSDHRYAVKILLAKQGPSGDARRQRFQREVDVLRRLEHPNIVRLHEAGHHGQYDWYAMDCIEGRELADLLVQGRLTIRQRLDMFVAICRAVAHAHERGVIHRDLKPSNVLVDPNDGIHVLDFGLAKVIESEPQDLRLTHDGSSLGTPYYMAPEQLIRPKDVDRRADVFALGVLLYEMLAGGRPFVGVTAVEVNDKILNLTPPAPSKVGRDVPAGLDAVVLKALQKDAAARFQDVDAMRREVDRVRKTLQARDAQPSGSGEVAMGLEWVARHRDGVIVGFVLATLFYVPLLLIIVVIVRLAR